MNGAPLAPPTNIYKAFEGTANRQTIIRVSKTPSAEGSRLVTVVPVASEDALRSRAWVENNRRIVDSLSNGRLAYVWLPNTPAAGYTYFTRYFYAQQQKEGSVIDERYNQGGQVADYIVNELDRKLMGYFATRDGKTVTSPTAGIFGPKVMIINESAGSGGDALPYMFKQRKLGPLVGTRTWGGLVGTIGVPHDDRRRRHHRAGTRVLRPERQVVGRERRHRAGHRGRVLGRPRSSRAATRSSSARCRKRSSCSSRIRRSAWRVLRRSIERRRRISCHSERVCHSERSEDPSGSR